MQHVRRVDFQCYGIADASRSVDRVVRGSSLQLPRPWYTPRANCPFAFGLGESRTAQIAQPGASLLLHAGERWHRGGAAVLAAIAPAVIFNQAFEAAGELF